MLVELRPGVEKSETKLGPPPIDNEKKRQTRHRIAFGSSSSKLLNLFLLNVKIKKRPPPKASTPPTTLIPMIAPVDSPEEAAAVVDEAEEEALEDPEAVSASVITMIFPPAPVLVVTC